MSKPKEFVYSEKSQAVLRFLLANKDVDFTTKEIAGEVMKQGDVEITSRGATAIINALVKKGDVVRVVVNDDGKDVKVVRLTSTKGVNLTEDDITAVNPKYTQWLKDKEARDAEKAAKQAAKDAEVDEDLGF